MTQEFGNYLKTLREERSMTQKDLAKTSGVHHNTINRAEAGEYSLKPETAINVVETLNIPDKGQIRFFLLASGFPGEFIDKLLDADKGNSEANIRATFMTP